MFYNLTRLLSQSALMGHQIDIFIRLVLSIYINKIDTRGATHRDTHLGTLTYFMLNTYNKANSQKEIDK